MKVFISFLMFNFVFLNIAQASTEIVVEKILDEKNIEKIEKENEIEKNSDKKSKEKDSISNDKKGEEIIKEEVEEVNETKDFDVELEQKLKKDEVEKNNSEDHIIANETIKVEIKNEPTLEIEIDEQIESIQATSPLNIENDSKENVTKQTEVIDYLKTKIRINEVLPDPNDSEKEFIELYNYSNKKVDLNNWILTDKTTNQFKIKNITIEAGEYLTFFKSNDFKFALNNSNESVFLVSPDNKIFSEINYTKSIKGQSFNFDENKWYWAEPTPNAENIINPTTKNYPKIIINEILPNPAGADNDQEFIELYNPTENDVDLTGWSLKNTTEKSEYNHYLKNQNIKAGEYLTLKKEDFSFSLHNTHSKTEFISPNPDIKFEMSYENPIEGRSLNFDSTENYWARPTPNDENNPNPNLINYSDLILSEILPNPIGDESLNEFIEIYNPNNKSVDLIDWSFKDSSSTGNYIFSSSKIIPAKSHLTIYRDEFDFALNNSGGESVYLIAPNQKIKSEINYETARENISYNFNLIEKNWRWSKYLTPNTPNKFNNLPQIKKFSISEKTYKNMYVEFEVEAFDIDGEDLKYRWEFGDSRKSYKQKTKHKYTETGTYSGNLRIQDGSEEVVKNFIIEIKKYPKHKVEIIKIMPNPVGKDSENEFIIVKNKSKENLNLEGWSIATGSSDDKLVNHPIHEKLKTKKGKLQKITRKHSAISLPNKVGLIELRRPDGSVADTVEYTKNGESIKENESYEQIDGEWRWILNEIPESLADKLRAQEIVAQALANEAQLKDDLLSQLVAHRLVHQPKKIEEKSLIKNRNRLQIFFTKINLLLSKLLPSINNFIAGVFNEIKLAWSENKIIVINKFNERDVLRVRENFSHPYII